MSSGTLARVAARKAAEVCQGLRLEDDARKLLRDGQTPKQFLDALAEKGLYADACAFLARALPKQEAVWWACQCVRPGSGAAASAVQAAEAWVAEPSEVRRRAAQPAAEAAGVGTPAGCAALAAFFSGGSLAPPDLPAVPPADDLTETCVAGALDLAAVQAEPEKAPEKYRKFLALGLEVAEGKNRWKEPRT